MVGPLLLVLPALTATVTQTHLQTAQPTDVLFAMDRSGSMLDVAAEFAALFPLFTETMDLYGVDFHTAVIVADDGCVAGSQLYVDASFGPAEAVFAITEQINGSFGSNTERGLTLLQAAYDEGVPGGCNHGLLRRVAGHHMVGITDEPEQSVNAWSTYVANMDFPTVHAVAGDYPTGCGSAAAGTGWWEASQGTGGLFLSICNAWDANLEALAIEIAESALQSEFPIPGPAIPASIAVTVDGAVSADWVYLPAIRAVVFLPGSVPGDGSVVRISFETP